MDIGNVITQLRVKSGFTQDKIAQDLCISRSAYAKWERNNVVLNLFQLKKIAAIYNIELDILVSMIERENTY